MFVAVVVVCILRMMRLVFAIRRKLVNNCVHNLFHFVPDHQRQQQRQINN
jgi:hypothetical protein